VCPGVFVLVCVSWCVCPDVCLPVCVYRCVFTGVCLPVCVYRCVFTGVCLPVCVYRCCCCCCKRFLFTGVVVSEFPAEAGTHCLPVCVCTSMDLKGSSLGVATSVYLSFLFVVFAVVTHTPR
jgi:hypothetical protein